MRMNILRKDRKAIEKILLQKSFGTKGYVTWHKYFLLRIQWIFALQFIHIDTISEQLLVISSSDLFFFKFYTLISIDDFLIFFFNFWMPPLRSNIHGNSTFQTPAVGLIIPSSFVFPPLRIRN